MTTEEALALLEPVNDVEPGPWALIVLRANRGRRWANKTDLKVVDGLCCWCNAKPVARGRQKYCHQDCVDSAARYTHPQSPEVKAFLLVNRQSMACAACGLDYTDEVVERVRRWDANNRRWAKLGAKDPHRVTYWQLGSETGGIWEVDHAVPIHKGGSGVGLGNVQVVCVSCHRRKSAQENSDRLKGLFRAT